MSDSSQELRVDLTGIEHRRGYLEWAVAFLALVSHLLARPPWLDECMTSMLVNDPSLLHAIASIKGGVENNPPGFFLIIWPVAKAAGALSVVQLRLVNMLFVAAGLACVYAAARHRVGRWPAAVGMLAAAAHPLLGTQLYQARFYGAWFAATAWLLALTMDPRRDSTLSRVILRSAAAALVVSIHWFGVIGVALICGADLLAAPAQWKRRSMPLAAALVTLIALSPFLISQRSGLAVPTWIGPTTPRTVFDVALWFFGTVAVVPILLVGTWLAGTGKGALRSVAATLREALPAMGILAFPLVLIVFAIAVQPVLLPRYLIVTPIGIGVVTALVVGAVPELEQRAVAAAGAFVLVATVLWNGATMARLNVPTDAQTLRNRAVADSLIAAGVHPLIFERRLEQYPLIQMEPSLAPSTATIDFDGAPSGVSQFTLFEHEMARRVTRMYPRYQLLPADSVRAMKDPVVFVRDAAQFAAIAGNPRMHVLVPPAYRVAR